MNLQKTFLLGVVISVSPLCAMEIEQCHRAEKETTKEFIERTKEPGKYNNMPQKYRDLCPPHGRFNATKISFAAWSWDESTLAILEYSHHNDEEQEASNKAQLTVIDPKKRNERGKVLYNVLIPKHKYEGLAISPCGKKYATVDISTQHDQYGKEVTTKTLTVEDTVAQKQRKIELPVMVRAMGASYRPNFNKQETKVIIHEQYVESLPHGASVFKKDIMLLPIDHDVAHGLVFGKFPCEQKMTSTQKVTEIIDVEENS